MTHSKGKIALDTPPIQVYTRTMPLLTPHWDTPKPKRVRYQSTTEEIKEKKKMANLKAYRKKLAKIKYDPSKMTLLERSSLDRSRLATLHHNRDIKIGGPWGPIVARRIARCIEAMNKEVDVIVLTNPHSKPPYTEYNQEYFDVFVRYHRITFDGRPIPEIGQVMENEL